MSLNENNYIQYPSKCISSFSVVDYWMWKQGRMEQLFSKEFLLDISGAQFPLILSKTVMWFLSCFYNSILMLVQSFCYSSWNWAMRCNVFHPLYLARPSYLPRIHKSEELFEIQPLILCPKDRYKAFSRVRRCFGWMCWTKNPSHSIWGLPLSVAPIKIWWKCIYSFWYWAIEVYVFI